MKPMKSNQEIWLRELTYAKQPRFWESFAIETKCCAEFLLAKFERAIHESKPDEDFRAFFGYKYVRMLFGYSLENLIKGLLLSGPESGRYIQRKKITFGKNGHNLLWLLNELKLPYSEQQAFFLKGWSVSAEWFGKYPFPLGVNQVLPEYQSMASSEALLKRTIRGKRSFIHNDLLHQDIGDNERNTFVELFNEVHSLYKT